MKYLLLIIILAASYAAPAYAKKMTDEEKKCISSMQLIKGEPKREFTIISPLDSRGGFNPTATRLTKKLKERACALKADAIIGYECYDASRGIPTTPAMPSEGFNRGTGQSIPVCKGTAINWKEDSK